MGHRPKVPLGHADTDEERTRWVSTGDDAVLATSRRFGTR
jgi:hypothetical protein